jgi:hypothetical protein
MQTFGWWNPPVVGRSVLKIQARSPNPGERQVVRKVVIQAPCLPIEPRSYSTSYIRSKFVWTCRRPKPQAVLMSKPASCSINHRSSNQPSLFTPTRAAENDDGLWSTSRSFAFVGLICTAILLSVNKAVKVILTIFQLDLRSEAPRNSAF